MMNNLMKKIAGLAVSEEMTQSVHRHTSPPVLRLKKKTYFFSVFLILLPLKNDMRLICGPQAITQCSTFESEANRFRYRFYLVHIKHWMRRFFFRSLLNRFRLETFMFVSFPIDEQSTDLFCWGRTEEGELIFASFISISARSEIK